MARFCEKCGAPVADGSRFYEYCGAPVAQNGGAAVQAAPAAEAPGCVRTPQTIEELLAFCERHKLPLAKMRFFIGLDYPGAKAFGIYRDADGQFVVYKNKADGSRAVRYRGPDEAHAVREIFEKLKDEATVQRAHAARQKSGYASSDAYGSGSGEAAALPRKKRRPNGLLIGILALAAAITIARTTARLANAGIPAGYYSYGGNTYYSQQDHWYGYDGDLDYWYPVEVADELAQNPGNYFESYSYNEDYGVSDFSGSGYYAEDSDSSSGSWDWDWDDDSDWDSDSDWDWDSDWDSDFSDWDSDW